MKIEIPMKVISEANSHEHWRYRQRRAKTQRYSTSWNLYCELGDRPVSLLPCRVTLTRLSPRKLDTDGLVSAFKAVRDGVADWAGVDDGDERWDWQYKQEKSKEYGIRIEIEANQKEHA